MAEIRSRWITCIGGTHEPKVSAQVGKAIYDRVLEVAAGKPTAAEVLGQEEYCVPYKRHIFAPTRDATYYTPRFGN